MAKRKSSKRASEKGNTSAGKRRQPGRSYTPSELFMAGCGALIVIMFLGIVITAIFGG